ncbi:MAG: aspartate/glutamate racemase family protein [Candidatus Lokiarchaeota archaeon]|nr:aspartate/glutamate racemase family protein [Candidatus Lokiarchaeota archaeon]
MTAKLYGGYSTYGEVIGILKLETVEPKVPGDIGNATSYSFPVKYKIVKGATTDRLVEKNDPMLLDLFICAAKELENEGVRAITTSCGFTAIFQKEMAEVLEIPVFMSSLIQVPLVSSMLAKNKKVGILTANKRRLTKKHLEAVNINNIPVCIAGMEEQENFSNMILKQQPFGNIEKIEKEVVEVSKSLVKQNPQTGAMVLECADMPPFAAAVQEAIGLPVFDINTLINYVYNAVVQKRYNGVYPGYRVKRLL